ncbi:MAG: hypothetical protein A2Y33_15055 [Spirochaetes bacterium GWF1_51_8]|nr:MAG: hypothetical protein A2Y33_15055 [Spirochaetes bacterium GWF1_51_8]
MGLKELLDSLSPIAMGNPIGIEVIFWRMIVALGFALIIGGVSYIAYSGHEFERSNLHAQILVTLVSAMVINVIGDNFARAIGLFGAMSFIRFRTTLRDTKDTAIFFFSVAVGMATGLGFFELALISMMIVLPLLIGLKYLPLFKTELTQIEFNCKDYESLKLVKDYIQKQKVKFTPTEIRENKFRLVYHVSMPVDKAFPLAEKAKSDNPELIVDFEVSRVE